MRLPRSLPRTRLRSIPNSRASRRRDGAAATSASDFAATSSTSSAASASSTCTGADFAGLVLSTAVGSLAGLSSTPTLSMERMTCPTEILSPSFTQIFVTVPAAVEGIGAMAFSFSSSMIVWPSLITSPSFTRRPTTTPESAPSPSFGSLTSIGLSLKTGHAKRAHQRCHQEKPQGADLPGQD